MHLSTERVCCPDIRAPFDQNLTCNLCLTEREQPVHSSDVAGDVTDDVGVAPKCDGYPAELTGASIRLGWIDVAAIDDVISGITCDAVTPKGGWGDAAALIDSFLAK